jgi:tRNA G18 (ribose-2'-O)-methylase SpoU
MHGEIDSMNVSVAAAILILKLKDNEDFKLPIFDFRNKKKTQFKKTRYENKLFANNSNHNSFLRQITEPQVDLVNKP